MTNDNGRKFVVNQELKMEAYSALKALICVGDYTYEQADAIAMELLKKAEQIDFITKLRIYNDNTSKCTFLVGVDTTLTCDLRRYINDVLFLSGFAKKAISHIVEAYSYNAIDVEYEEEA